MLDNHAYTRWFTTKIWLSGFVPHNLCFIVFIQLLSRCFFCWRVIGPIYLLLFNFNYKSDLLWYMHAYYICCMMQYSTFHARSWANIFSIIAHTLLWNSNDFTNQRQVVHFYLSLRSFHWINNWPSHFSFVCDLINFVWWPVFLIFSMISV